MKNVRTIIFILFIFFLALLIGAVIFIKTVDIDTYRPRIEKALSQQLGRDVSIGKIEMSLGFRGVVIAIERFLVKGDAALGESDFAAISLITADMDVLTYIKSREIVVRKIKLESPRIHIVKGKNDVTNIPFPVRSSAEKNPVSVPVTVKSPQESDRPAIPLVNIRDIDIENGILIYEDLLSAPSVNIMVSPVNIQVRGFNSTARPFRVDAQAGLFNKQANVLISSTAAINVSEMKVVVSDIKLVVDLAKLDIEKMRLAIPQFDQLGLGRLAGELRVVITSLVAGPSGLKSLAGEGSLIDATATTSHLSEPVENIDARLTFDENNIVLNEFVCEVGGGRVYGQGALKGYTGDAVSHVSVKTEGLPVQGLSPEGSPHFMVGNINMDAQADTKGLDPQRIIENLSANGVFEIMDAKLIDVNLLKLVFEQLTFIPEIGNKIMNAIPEATRNKLTNKDTELDKISARLNAENGVVSVNEFIVDSEDFTGKGEAQYDLLEGKITLIPELLLGKNLSESVIHGVPEFALLDKSSEGKINIPLTRYSGPVEGLRIYPDLDKIVKEVFVNKGKSELRKAIFKALDIEDDGQVDEGVEGVSADGGAATGTGNEADNEKPIEKILLDNVLDAVFGK